MKVYMGLAGAVLLAGGCAFEAGTEEDADVGQTQEAMSSGTPGQFTGLVARLRRGGSICSAAFIPYTDPASSTSPNSTWVITANHCIDQGGAPTVSSEYSVVSSTGQVIAVDRHYFHPLSERDFEDFGTGTTPEVLGRVDVALLRLAGTATLPASTKSLNFTIINGSTDLFIESALLQDVGWQPNYEIGDGYPSTTFLVRSGTDIDVDDGDSGASAYRYDLTASQWVNVGIVSSFGTDFTLTHPKYYVGFVNDARYCHRPFDIGRPDDEYCSSSCPCGPGEGDCDADSECFLGLTCHADSGDKVGLPDYYDVCLEDVRQGSNTSGYCDSIFGCQIYEGDCNSNEACIGDLICRENVGYAVGLNDNVDVCDLPRQPDGLRFNRNGSGTRDETSGRCTAANPCALGDGDCDQNDDNTCRGYLRCKANVGNHFGFTDNNIDVCVHPSYY
jgi:hypothetical protein